MYRTILNCSMYRGANAHLCCTVLYRRPTVDMKGVWGHPVHPHRVILGFSIGCAWFQANLCSMHAPPSGGSALSRGIGGYLIRDVIAISCNGTACNARPQAEVGRRGLGHLLGINSFAFWCVIPYWQCALRPLTELSYRIACKLAVLGSLCPHIHHATLH